MSPEGIMLYIVGYNATDDARISYVYVRNIPNNVKHDFHTHPSFNCHRVRTMWLLKKFFFSHIHVIPLSTNASTAVVVVEGI